VGLLGRRTRAVVALAALCALAIGADARAGQPSVSIFEYPGKVHGKIHTDGTFTVGQQETLTVTGLPGKYRLQAYVFAPSGAQECFQLNEVFCEAEPLFRVPGTARFRSSKKGRASLTFVTPPGYQVSNFKDPLKSHPVYFINGQAIDLEVDATYRERRHGRLAQITSPVDQAVVVAEVPAPPPSS
jgi:hypothetical protein